MGHKLYGAGYRVFKDGKVLNLDGSVKKWSLNGRGYLISRFYQEDGTVRCKSQHRLVAEMFLTKPYGKDEVDHIDGDRTNNRVSNLRWVTHSENVQHSYTSGRRDVSGARNANSVYTEEQIRAACRMLEQGASYPFVFRETGVKPATSGAIKKRRQWVDISRHYIF